MKRAIIFLIMTLACGMGRLSAAPPTKVQADEAYDNTDYEQAVEQYVQLLGHTGVASADLYYNLGNAYFRLDSIPQAVLAYERALRLQPGDDDIRHNLQVARSKTADRIAPEREMFFVTWYHALVSALSVDAWAYVALVALVLAVMLLAVYLFTASSLLQRSGFFGSIAMLALFLLANIFAWQHRHDQARSDEAIVLQAAVAVKNIPAESGTDEFTIHAGTKVSISDDSMDEWMQIRLPDGREGWIRRGSVEHI